MVSELHYAQERERPSTWSIRDGEGGKGDERLPNNVVHVVHVVSVI